jgi:putative transposase
VNPSTYYDRLKKEAREQEEKKVSEGRPIPGYSWTKTGRRIPDEQIKEWIMEVLSDDASHAYGYRKMTKILRRGKYQLVVNKKKMYRLFKAMGILRPQRKKSMTRPKKVAQNRTITASNQLFEMDIKYGYIVGEDRFFFVQECLDVFDRSIVTYHIGLHCTAEDVKRTLQEAMFKRQCWDTEKKPIVRTDNGPQYVSHLFQDACAQWGMEHERIPPRTPNMNAHIESFHRLLQEECFDYYGPFATYAEAYEAVVRFMEGYNTRRIHSSIYDLAPLDYFEQCQAGTLQGMVVHL